jgi:multidrug efflux pump subunit AcrA (membrane-fusion protein)
MSTAPKETTREVGLLPQDPPPWFARAAGWTLLSLTLVAILVVSLVRLPESVVCAFAFEPKGGADPIQTRFDGTLEEVRVQPGQVVKSGDILFTVRADEIREGRRSLAEAEEELRARRARLAQLEAEHQLRLAENSLSARHATREIEILEPALTAQHGLLERFQTNADSMAQTEIVELQRDIAETAKDLGLTRARLETLEMEKGAIEHAWERAQLDEQSAIIQWESRRAAALRLLEGTEGDLLVIRAPSDGVVTFVARRQVGSVVQTGEDLMRMAANGAALHVRLAVPERGLGRLAVGQPVRLFFEAYPYERFGTVQGRLSWVSPAAASAVLKAGAGESTGYFEAFAEVGPAGAPWQLGPGMAGTARIQVGRRTILEMVFEPIRGLVELAR